MKYKLLELTARYMRKKMVKIKAPEGAMDVCGTGGAGKNTYNISTAVAFVVSACGVPVAKHGNIASSSKCGSSDVLRELGVNINASPAVVQKCLDEIGICYMHAPNFHPHFKLVGKLRKLFGKRTVFNLLGVLLNPAEVKYQLVGVYDKELCEPTAEILKNMGAKFAMVGCHESGLDEFLPCGRTYYAKVSQDVLYEPSNYIGDTYYHDVYYDEIEGGDAKQNAKELLKLLDNRYSLYAECVILNATVALVVSTNLDFKDARVKAIDAIYTGKALEKLNELIKLSNEEL